MQTTNHHHYNLSYPSAAACRLPVRPHRKALAATSLVLEGHWLVLFAFFTKVAYVSYSDSRQTTLPNDRASASAVDEKLDIDLVTFTLAGTYDDNRPILIDAENPERYLSRRKATDLVNLLTGAFELGSTVCLHLPNDVLYPVLVLGILASRARWTGTNPAYTVSELEHHFRVSKTRYIITTAEYQGVVSTAAAKSGQNAEVILFTDLLSDQHQHDESSSQHTTCSLAQSAGPRALCDLIHASPFCLDAPSPNPAPSDIAALMQTSGTTGLPKMAAISHSAMVHELQAIADDDASKGYEVRRLFCTPIFHAFSSPEMIFNSLRLGRTSYFMRRFDDTFAQKVSHYNITEIFGPPAMLLKLINQPRSRHLLQSLRYVAYGGAPLGFELRRRFLNLFTTKPRLVPVYGMTEGGWYTTFHHPEDDDTGAVGRPIAVYDIRILPQGTDSTAGQPIGEILVRGPRVMDSYFDNPKATTAAFHEGWLKTGDIGYMHHGKLYLIDRIKDMIKVNAWQVSPIELQNALLELDAVVEAAVFGVGEGVDEHPMACVVVRDNKVTEEAIKTHLRSRLASYKVRWCEVRFVTDIPKSSTGKIQKQRLKDMILADDVPERHCNP